MDIYQQLERDEGYKRFPYRDTVGKLTVGIGRNLDDVGISKEEAYLLLENDLQRTMAGLRQALPWFDRLSIARQGVLVNMAFNMGVGGLLKFEKMLAALEKRDYEETAREMLDSVWAGQVSNRARRLAEQIRKDEWV